MVEIATIAAVANYRSVWARTGRAKETADFCQFSDASETKIATIAGIAAHSPENPKGGP